MAKMNLTLAGRVSYAMRHIGLMVVAMLLIAGLCYYYIRREEIMEEE